MRDGGTMPTCGRTRWVSSTGTPTATRPVADSRALAPFPMTSSTTTMIATTRNPLALNSPAPSMAAPRPTRVALVGPLSLAMRAVTAVMAMTQAVNGTSFQNVTANAPNGGAKGSSTAAIVVGRRGAPRRLSSWARKAMAAAMAVVCRNVTTPTSPVAFTLSHNSAS
ncbi:hypothetical protein [Nonomuraea recticatena]|uniref:hypothetical protein n=1 Tax=Nonomuraea recticatena TaxID=46178 RepID=UPI0036114649